MKSIVVKKEEDLLQIDNQVKEIEFYQYEGIYDILNLDLDSITFTRMNVFLDSIPLNIKELSFFDCDFLINELDKFQDLEVLEITNSSVDILDIVNLSNLKSINLNFCSISNIEKLTEFFKLEEISLVGVDVSNYDFLAMISSLKKVVVNNTIYDSNKELFQKLVDKGVLFLDMMGGVFNDL